MMRKKKKKDKKIYKTSKKTGALVFKKAKKQKGAKLHARFRVPKESKVKE